MKPGEREAGLLNVRTRNEAVEAIRAGDELERQTEDLGPAAQERADAYAGNGRHCGDLESKASTWHLSTLEP